MSSLRTGSDEADVTTPWEMAENGSFQSKEKGTLSPLLNELPASVSMSFSQDPNSALGPMEHLSELLSEYAGIQYSHNDIMGKCCIANYNYVVLQMSAHFDV